MLGLDRSTATGSSVFPRRGAHVVIRPTVTEETVTAIRAVLADRDLNLEECRQLYVLISYLHHDCDASPALTTNLQREVNAALIAPH